MCDQNTICQKCKKPSDSKWCDDCWYPGIDDDYAEFRALLEEGHTYAYAAVMSGWKGIEEI